jgi:UDP-glucose 4-epimerase
MKDALVLVTGGGGFIGTHLCRDLIDRGYRVRVFDNMYRPDLRSVETLLATGRAEIMEGDVRYADSVRRGVDGADYVVHLAALAINKSVVDHEESVEVNLVGSQRVFAAAADAGVKRLVLASSASVYGEPTRLPMAEDDPLNPATPYCLSKLASEHLLRFYGNQYDMPWMALRYFNVYGPGQKTGAYYTSVILTFIRRLLSGQAPIIQGNGEQSMDFVHVSDLVRATAIALECDETNHVLNIGTGVSTTIAELASILIDAVGVDVEPEFEPREVLVSRRAADISLAKKVLGWEPTITADDGLRELAVEMMTSVANEPA